MGIGRQRPSETPPATRSTLSRLVRGSVERMAWGRISARLFAAPLEIGANEDPPFAPLASGPYNHTVLPTVGYQEGRLSARTRVPIIAATLSTASSASLRQCRRGSGSLTQSVPAMTIENSDELPIRRLPASRGGPACDFE